MTTYADQTIFADPIRADGHDATGEPGDCYRACLAIIAGVDPTTMPNFSRFWIAGSWYAAARLWAETIGRDLGYVDIETAGNVDWFEPGQLLIGSGPSPRGPFDHCVVVDHEFELVHDPHPSRDGLVRLEGIEFLMPCPVLPRPYIRALPAAVSA